MRILVADDDPAIREVLENLLTTSGYEVTVASTGTEAAQVWQDEHIPFVITDWVMPGLDGEKLCNLIRSAPSPTYTYIIMVTGNDQQDDVVTGLTAGADDYMTKPYNIKELLLRVKAGIRILGLETALMAKVNELQSALDRVQTLEGLLPICAYCKRIRDNDGGWQKMETYIEGRTNAAFSHGVCPECYHLYIEPEL